MLLGVKLIPKGYFICKPLPNQLYFAKTSHLGFCCTWIGPKGHYIGSP